MNTLIRNSIAFALAAASAGLAQAAEPDWNKVAARKVVLFYPGASPIEWILTGTEHSGLRGMKKGETCAACHDEEAADMGKKMASGLKLEPTPIKGKAAAIPVSVQAAHDGANLYLRFSWKAPATAGAAKQDAENQVKLAFMLEENKIAGVPGGGCWATCHADSRTMPAAKDDKKTKYVSGTVFDLVQWKSKGKPADGHVSDKRVTDGGKALVSAVGKLAGDTWTVVFTRKLAGGGEGDIALAAGKTYNFGFAIHDDWTHGRFHHVSLGYTLGIDAKADITAAKP